MALNTTVEKYQRGPSDAALNPAALAIPATATTANGGSIDLGAAYSSGKNPRLVDMDIRVVVEAQTTTTLPDAQTIIIDLEHSTDDSSFTTLLDNFITVTGAGGVGALQSARQIRIPNDSNRYIRQMITTNGSGTGRAGTDSVMTTRF